MIKSIEDIPNTTIINESEIDEYREICNKLNNLSRHNFTELLEKLYEIQETLINSSYFAASLPQQDIHINPDNTYSLISSKVYTENGVLIKELVIPNNNKRNPLSESSEQSFFSDEIEDTTTEDELLKS